MPQATPTPCLASGAVRSSFQAACHEQKGMHLAAAQADIDIQALSNSINILAKLEITQTAERITIRAKEELRLEGGGSYSVLNAHGITEGTPGGYTNHAA